MELSFIKTTHTRPLSELNLLHYSEYREKVAVMWQNDYGMLNKLNNNC